MPILLGELVFPAIHALDDANCAAPPTGSVENNPFALVMLVGELAALLPAVFPLKKISTTELEIYTTMQLS